ncbi:type I-E CRISPR-associated protein Cse1/CasA [Aggregatilineales bacterium SYSU G02658]
MSFSYNLIDHPWIPALTLNHELVELSLKDVICNAHELRMLAAETPLHDVGVMTVLLAILHRIYGPAGIIDWEKLRHMGRFLCEQSEEYFANWYDRFDLFHPERPFMQTLGTLEIKARPIIHLLISMANTGALFSHQTETQPVSLSAAQAARELVASRYFRTSGPANPARKLYFSSSPYTDGILFYVNGKTLFETLLLNLVAYPQDRYFPSSDEDQPTWEMEEPYTARSIPLGYLDYLTWPSLRLRLVPEQAGDSVRVYRAYAAPGLKLDEDVISPQKLYTYRPKDDKWLSLSFSKSRALWRDYDTIVSVNEREGYRGLQVLRWLTELADNSDYIERHDRFLLRAVGFLADQAKPVFHQDQLLPLSLSLLKSPHVPSILRKARDLAEKCREALYQAQKKLANTLLAHGGPRQPDRTDTQNQIKSWSADDLYWARLEPLFWEWLDGVPQSPDTALRDWAKQLSELTVGVFNEVVNLVGDVTGAEQGAVEGSRKLRFELKKILGELVS